MRDSNPQALFNYVADKLNSPRAAYVHVVQGDTFHGREGAAAFDYGKMKDDFGLWMLNNGYDRDLAARTVMHNEADMISFGRVTIARSGSGASLAGQPASGRDVCRRAAVWWRWRSRLHGLSGAALIRGRPPTKSPAPGRAFCWRGGIRG